MQELFNKLVFLSEKHDWDLFNNILNANPDIVKYKDEFGSTLLLEIIADANKYIIERIVKLGADINVVDDEGMTLVHILIEKRKNIDLDKVQLILNYGFNIELSGFNGWRPIHKAVFHKCYDVVRFLVENGADINARTESCHMKTPLMIAANNNDLEMIKLLIKMGADYNLKDSYSNTVYFYTNFIRGWKVRRYLNKLSW